MQYTGHELGPAVIFEHDPLSIRLDHFLRDRDRDLSLSTRLDLVRQLAEVMQYAHQKRVVHRALSPRSILVGDADSARPRLKVFNWQAGYRAAAGSSTGTVTGSAVAATSHVGQLVDDPTTAYMAPDIFVAGDSLGEHLDVFSLGAVAYHILSGQPPAADGTELAASIRTSRGLQLAAVLDGASAPLCELIQFATHPDVSFRLETVADFLDLLDTAEEHLTSPVEDYTDNPSEAVAGDLLPGGLRVERRLGQGSSSTALLVSRPLPASAAAADPGEPAPAPATEQFILKIASSPDHNDRLRAEADVLRGLAADRDPRIVGFHETVEIGGHAGFLMRPIFTDKEKSRIETLGGRIRKEGRLHIELLERLGEDLIDVVRHLDRKGVLHRDIKPDNIAVGRVSKEHTLQLVLFDFSLAAVPQENIRAGTVGYLDPMLPLRRSPPRFDSYAERYAVAATLHEMATGTLPKWGDGRSDPSQIDAEITIDADLFDTELREKLAAFFTRAFRREIALRFDNAEQMLAEWKACFAGLVSSPLRPDHEGDDELRRILAPATLETPVATLGLGTRATNALDRANVLTVLDLLRFNRGKLESMRGVGAKTRREITSAVDILRERLATPASSTTRAAVAPPTTVPVDTTLADPEPPVDADSLSIDAIAARLLAKPKTARADTGPRVVEMLLGRDPRTAGDAWPTQSAIATHLDLTRARIGQLYGKLLAKAIKDPVITSVRSQLVEFLSVQGGAATADELAEWLATARPGELASATRPGDPATAEARRTALGIVRIAVDAEGLLVEPRLMVRRDGRAMIVAASSDLADYAVRLGRAADRLATAEPLTTPASVVERLRQVQHPAGAPIESDSRLVRLAAGASQSAAVSSRMELYPRGMDPLRALKLSLGAVAGARELTDTQIRERVASRYPDSSPLPPRPELDGLLREAGLGLAFDPAAAAGRGAYVAPILERPSMTTGSTLLHRMPTAMGAALSPVASPEVADARSFEDRLRRAAQAGSFLQMVVRPREYERAAAELCTRFGVVRIDVEDVVLDALRETANSLDVDWSLVLAADADPTGPDWQNLRQFADHARPLIAARLSQPGATVLLVYADILVRYGLRSLLTDLQQQIGSSQGPQGVWLLVAGGTVALLDNQPVGVPGQQAVIPDAWLENLHRAGRPLALST